tara:strand:+ start:651 stop:914 length:264 start_codon:yes stop_codon:yes gene_type:complete
MQWFLQFFSYFLKFRTHFKKEGYNTSLFFGKCHLGSSYSYEPKNRGFDEVFVRGGFVMSQLGYFYGNDHIDATYIHNNKFLHLKGFF